MCPAEPFTNGVFRFLFFRAFYEWGGFVLVFFAGNVASLKTQIFQKKKKKKIWRKKQENEKPHS